jgi:glycerol-3-phosphate dehydrogenase (NAD(P)+)
VTADRPRTVVLGAGAWGTTLAWMLAREEQAVTLWARRPDLATELATTRENPVYLPGTRLPDAVTVTGDLAAALSGARCVIMAIPSHGLRGVAARAEPYLTDQALVICATKGLERPSGLRMSQVLYGTLGARRPRLVALSGPNLSAEIARGMPAVSVVASTDPKAALEAQELLSNSLFRVYTNSDIIGVELCGAMKNIIALGAGISDGLGFGANVKAALLTRGMAEIARLGLRLGAKQGTFSGIAGIGDLMATCGSPLSRNWTVGFRLGQGEAPDAIRQSLHNVAEGIFTTAAAWERSRAIGVETPITAGVYRVLYEGSPPADEVSALMSRRWRAEEE